MTSNSPQSPTGTATDVTARGQTQVAGSMSFGAQLRAARLAKGLSIGDCVQVLHLPAQRLKQLEEDVRSDQAGDQVYLRGYIAKYGQLVGLDEDIIARELNTLVVPAPKLMVSGAMPPVKYHLERYARAATYLVLTAVIVVPVAWLGLRGTFDHNISHLDALDARPVAQQDTVAPPTSLAAQTAAAQVAQPEVAAPQLAAASSAQAVSVVAVPPPLVGASAAATPQTDSLAAAEAASSQVASPPLMAAMVPQPASQPVEAPSDVVGSGAHSLALNLSQESWVAVKTPQGTRLVYGTLPAGSSKTFHSDQGFNVRIGNASGAQVMLDGQPVSLDGYRRGNVAYFKVAVRDGKAETSAF